MDAPSSPEGTWSGFVIGASHFSLALPTRFRFPRIRDLDLAGFCSIRPTLPTWAYFPTKHATGASFPRKEGLPGDSVQPEFHRHREMHRHRLPIQSRRLVLPLAHRFDGRLLQDVRAGKHFYGLNVAA